ncbi:MAG: LamG-like jellyroll fold domain-containing protein, partial [Planctomycetota bacterium]
MPKDSFFDFLFQLSAKNQRKRTEQQRERREQPAKRSEQQRNGHPWRRLPAVETLTKRQLLAANLGAVTETAADTLTVDLDTQSLAGTRDANAEVTFQYGLRSGAVGAGTGGTDVLLAGDLSGAGFDQVIAVRQVDGVLQFLGDTDRDTGDEYRFRFGSADFTPLIADMNADGIDDIVVVDTQTPSNLLEWYVSYGQPGANPFPSDDSTLTVDAAFNFGVDGDNALAVTGVPDMPRVGDLNGDGRADVFAVRDDGTNLDWYVSTEDAFPNSTSTFLDLDLTVDNFGVSASIPVVGDWAETGVRDYFGFITESASPSVWNLDSDGDFTVDITPSFGTSGSQYIAGNWADVQWDGSAGDNLFSNAANWSGDAVPTTGQSVVIDQPGATPVVVADISETLGDLATRESLRTQAGDLIIGGELRAEGSVEVAGGTLRLESASSIGSVNLQAGELILDAALTTPSLAFDGGGLAVTTGASVSDLFFDVSAAGGSIRADGGGPVIFGNRFNLTGDLTVGGTEQLVLSGDIDGAGGLVKIDSASLRLTNNNGYAGETLINGGEIFLTDNGLLGSGAGDTRIGANATLRLDANRTISENLILDGDGARVRMADGSLLSGSVEIAGAGTYRIEPTLSGDTFTIAGSVFQSLSHDGLQIGTTGVDSRVIVPGNLNVESGVQLVGGTLEVNGSLTTTPARPLVLNSNTTLAGTGAIAGAVSANFNSRIEPGSDRGTLAFSGELEMQAGSFLEIEIGGTEPGTLPSNHDQIVFDGSRLDLESGLQLLVNGPNPTNGDTITLLRREGTDPNAFVFGGLPEGGVAVDDRGNRYRITYVGGDGNDVVLTADSTASTSIVVTTAADAGVGTLRDAILRAQSAPGLDTIEFDIPGTGPHRIQLVDPLPQINSQVILDGYTQPGASPNTSPAGFNANLQIIVDGGIPGAGITLGLLSDGSTVRGLNIQNSNRGLTVNQSGGHTIVGNAIGTDVTGTLAQGNSQGIRIQSGEGTRVGTPDVADRNLISGQTQAGVTISGATTGLNFIQNNLIGVDASGVRPLGNGTFGVHLQDQTFGNLIGGNGSGEANVIAASGAEGVRLQNVANGNQIIGNRIGTDVSSTLALGNQTDGILVLSEATNTVIADNVISGNTDDGIRVSGGTIDGTDIRGNRIGVNESGNRHIDGTLALWTVEGGLVTDVVGENQPSSTAGLSFPAGLSGDAVSTWPSGHIEIPEGNLNPEQLTLDAWVRPDGPSDNADSVGGRIVGKNVASGESISLYWRSQDDRFLFFYGRNNAEQIISTHSFPTGDWYHIAVTYDGDTARMFVNGVLEAEKTSGTPLPYNPAEPWTIGSSAAFYRGQGFPRRFNGPIDEVGLYDRALSPEEIRAIAADGTASKSASLGNLGNGIVVNAGATNTTIGGTTPEDRNIISDNDLNGVLIQTATTSNLTLTGNYIGVDGSGSRDLGNGVAGVRIEGSPNHTVGGSVPGAGNVISGNATGIEVLGLDSAGTVIAGNLIGVDATGMSAIGNDIGITIGDGTA